MSSHTQQTKPMPSIRLQKMNGHDELWMETISQKPVQCDVNAFGQMILPFSRRPISPPQSSMTTNACKNLRALLGTKIASNHQLASNKNTVTKQESHVWEDEDEYWKQWTLEHERYHDELDKRMELAAMEGEIDCQQTKLRSLVRGFEIEDNRWWN